jgi:hypothetical protein
MGGVGSFEKENKTLYVGNIAVGSRMEEAVAKHFSEWGEIEYSTTYSLTFSSHSKH